MDPAVRLTRLVRSRSGRFEDAYELREKDVLGTGMTGGVIVGKNKHTGVPRMRLGGSHGDRVRSVPKTKCLTNKKSSFISKNGLNTVCHS